jgi:hypothetical protein
MRRAADRQWPWAVRLRSMREEVSMRTFLRLCIGLAATAPMLLSSAALAQDSYDVRSNVNFAEIKTFAFKATPPMAPVAEKTTTYDSPLVRERTQAAIAAQLESRGLRRNDEHPDVYVVTHRTYKVEYYYPYGWGAPYAWGGSYGLGWGASSYGGGYEELRGTLTVDLEDAKTGALLWRGVETNRVHQTSKPSKRDKYVNEQVMDVFKHLPIPGAVATTGVR